MHMADALLSPAVGAGMWALSGLALAYSARRVEAQARDYTAPLMGVLGAFVFAAQMINFSIPATGSSGHLGGGLLLSVLLGPHAALIVIASVLTVQALFFADGGLLALGANIFNLGVLPCFVAYPLIYRAIASAGASDSRVVAATLAAAVAGLLLGSLGVVLQTVASGITSLSFNSFVTLMVPIHLAIGIVEGLATSALLLFIRRARPDLLDRAAAPRTFATRFRPLFVSLAVAAAVTAGMLSWFASTQPDGLEWSVDRAAGAAGVTAPGPGVHGWLARVQEGTSFLPDYDFATQAHASDGTAEPAWPNVSAGTSVAGLTGGGITLALVWLVAWLIRRRHQIESRRKAE
jgi:cobalt/nickel transport system permease protein